MIIFVELNVVFEMGVLLGRCVDIVLSGEDSLFLLIVECLGYKVGYWLEFLFEYVILKMWLIYEYLFKFIEV